MVKRNRRAAQVALNRKLRLERSLYNDMAAIFKDIAAKAGGAFFNVAQYEDDIEEAIKRHYLLVFKEFGDDYREEHGLKLTEIQAAMFAANTAEVFDARAKRQARIITATNRKQLAHIKKLAEEQMPKLLEINPNLSFYHYVSDLYGATLLRRVETISIYETQWSAEFSRANEVAFLTRGKGVQTKARKRDSNFKRWDAVGDDRMRDWHAEADSTVIPIDEPFEVNGEELMYPGDESLGATASNIINCRCTVSYEIDEDSLTGVEEPVSESRNPKNKIRTRRKEKTEITQEDLDALVSHFEVLEDWAVGKLRFLRESDGEALTKYVEDVRVLVDDALERWARKEPMTSYYLDSIHNKMKDIRSKFTGTFVLTEARPATEEIFPVQPIDVSKVPPGFEIDHEKAMKRAEEEIIKVFGVKEDMDNNPDLSRFKVSLGPQTHQSVREKIAELNKKDYGGRGSKIIKSQDGTPLYETLTRRAIPVDRPHTKDFFTNPNEEIMAKSLKAAMSTIEDTFQEVTEMMAPSLYNSRMDNMVTQLSYNTGRASADPAMNAITIFMDSRLSGQINDRQLTFQVAHEFGHHIEFENSVVLRRFQDWRNKRIKAAREGGEEWKYDHDNEAALLKDGFYNHYISRVYDNGYTEALSMGVEALFDPYKFNTMLEKDPEHLQLVWATLRGY